MCVQLYMCRVFYKNKTTGVPLPKSSCINQSLQEIEILQSQSLTQIQEISIFARPCNIAKLPQLFRMKCPKQQTTCDLDQLSHFVPWSLASSNSARIQAHIQVKDGQPLTCQQKLLPQSEQNNSQMFPNEVCIQLVRSIQDDALFRHGHNLPHT